MQIEKRQGSEVKTIGTFNNNRFYGDVTEYSFTTTKKLNSDEIIEVLKQNGINLYGFISTAIKEVDYSIEQMAKVFRYTACEVMYQ